jgi:hypothetical protein
VGSIAFLSEAASLESYPEWGPYSAIRWLDRCLAAEQKVQQQSKDDRKKYRRPNGDEHPDIPSPERKITRHGTNPEPAQKVKETARNEQDQPDQQEDLAGALH